MEEWEEDLVDKNIAEIERRIKLVGIAEHRKEQQK
jgi:hypothetical protein